MHPGILQACHKTPQGMTRADARHQYRTVLPKTTQTSPGQQSTLPDCGSTPHGESNNQTAASHNLLLTPTRRIALTSPGVTRNMAAGIQADKGSRGSRN